MSIGSESVMSESELSSGPHHCPNVPDDIHSPELRIVNRGGNSRVVQFESRKREIGKGGAVSVAAELLQAHEHHQAGRHEQAQRTSRKNPMLIMREGGRQAVTRTRWFDPHSG